MFDFTQPWYQPLYRRIGVVLVCAILFAMDAWSGNPFWMILFAAATVFTFWTLILTFPPKPKD